MNESTRNIINQFPYPRKKDQHKALANYFEAKKTESRTNAAKTADINYRTAKKIEEAYEDLTEEEKLELNKFLLHKHEERNHQIQSN